MQLTEESQHGIDRFDYPNFDTFKDIPDSFNFRHSNSYYEVSVHKHTDYIWFYFKFGNPIPRDENLTNIDTGEKKENPREDIEAELLKQLFCLYHYSQKKLYLSNANKQNLLKAVVDEKLESNFIIKSIFKTKEEFIALLKTVNEISFTEVRNLFNENSKERQALIDLTGTDAPDDFTIKAKYSKNKIRNFLNHLFETKSKPDSSLKDLIIRGTDENNFSVIFNNDTFSRKVIIQSEKDENATFNPESIKNELLKGIKQ